MPPKDKTMSKTTSGDAALDQKISEWMEWDKDEKTKVEIQSLLNDGKIAELNGRMMGRLSFGTAGMRGAMEAGFNRMNALTIIQLTQGMLKYLRSQRPNSLNDNGVIIGYDGRHNSRRFALLTAGIFARDGVKVYLFQQVVPTPYVSYGVTHYGCDAGVMVTASHNPKQDNGFKAYWNNGAQILCPHDKNIQSEILNHLAPWEGSWDDEFALKETSNVVDCTEAISVAYMRDAQKFCFGRDVNSKSPLRFTYTPFHGVGSLHTPQAIAAFGFPADAVIPVKEQWEPDGDFPTVKNPNPEEGREVLEYSFKAADAAESLLILANDPDADRLQIAEKQADGEWRVFNGNEIGGLLAWWVWHVYKAKQGADNINPGNVYFLNSAVSSQIVKSMAAVEGFQYRETLTGFKWMGNLAQELRADGKTVLLAWEESIGYMPGETLDKDGVLAAAMFADFQSYLQNKGSNLAAQLLDIYRLYGYHLNANSYFICRDPDKKAAIFNRLRCFTSEEDKPEEGGEVEKSHNGQNKNGGGGGGGGDHPNPKSAYPKQIGGYLVKFVRDLTVGFDNSQPENKPTLPVDPKSEMITFTLDTGSVVTIRGSGTEPKIKYYIEFKTGPGCTAEEVPKIRQQLKALESSVREDLIQATKNGL